MIVCYSGPGDSSCPTVCMSVHHPTEQFYKWVRVVRQTKHISNNTGFCFLRLVAQNQASVKEIKSSRKGNCFT